MPIEPAVYFFRGMPRSPRFLPHPGATVEITQRTIQGRYLFKPSPRLNALVVGCLEIDDHRERKDRRHGQAIASSVAIARSYFATRERSLSVGEGMRPRSQLSRRSANLTGRPMGSRPARWTKAS